MRIIQLNILAIGLAVVSSEALGQNSGNVETPTPSHSATPSDLSKLFRDLDLLDPAARQAELRSLVQGSHTQAAAMAATALIRAGDAESVDAIAERIITWPPNDQIILLQSLSSKTRNSHSFANIARSLLAHAVHDPGVLPDRVVVGMAALVVSLTSSETDKELIRSGVRRFPDLDQLWRAAAYSKAASEPETVIALALISDASRSLRLRVSAAAAISHMNPIAADLVRRESNAFIDTYGKSNSSEILMKSSLGTPDEKKMWRRFREDLDLFGLFHVLPESDGAALVASATDSQNEIIRMTAALIAIDRWPSLMPTLEAALMHTEQWPEVLGYAYYRGLDVPVPAGEHFQRFNEVVKTLNHSGMQGLFPFAHRAIYGL